VRISDGRLLFGSLAVQCRQPGAGLMRLAAVQVIRNGLFGDQAELARVVCAKKQMQERVLAGIPFRPAVLPVRPSVVAGILAKDGYRRGCA